jgi:hypothetical protein
MGGGGGRGRTTLGDISGLIDKAKDELRRAQSSQKRNVFLSFAYEDLDEVNLLRGQAKNENSDIEFNDWSVREPYDSSRADYIKQRIGERISQCSVTVVYISQDTAKSQWVSWEIEESIRRGKKVVAVHKGDKAPPNNPPAALLQNRVPIVPWSGLAEALSKL